MVRWHLWDCLVQLPCSEKGRPEQVSQGFFQSGCEYLGDTHSPAYLDNPSQCSFNGEKAKRKEKLSYIWIVSYMLVFQVVPIAFLHWLSLRSLSPSCIHPPIKHWCTLIWFFFLTLFPSLQPWPEPYQLLLFPLIWEVLQALHSLCGDDSFSLLLPANVNLFS